MRPLLRILLLALCLSAAAAPAAAGGSRRADPPPNLEDLKRQANQAARRYSQTQADYSRLGDELAKVERQVTELEGRLAPLRTIVTRRAVAVYQAGAGLEALVAFGDTPTVLQSARAAKLVAEVSARDTAAGEALAKRGGELRDRQALLVDRRREAEQALGRLEAERSDVERKLAALVAPGQGLQARGVEGRPAGRVSRAKSSRLGRASSVAPGASAEPALPAVFVCPIKGPVAYSRDFGAPRRGGRMHEGNDLMNPRGTENVAVVAGRIETRPWSGGGLVIFLAGDDGNRYVYMHLLRLIGPVPRHVEQSEVIALTGNSGDAQGYHTHFEFHPGGGPAADPFPLISTHC
jgi:murein DD-endopeptidase MepM/ murein hydrolase activator NlpD